MECAGRAKRRRRFFLRFETCRIGLLIPAPESGVAPCLPPHSKGGSVSLSELLAQTGKKCQSALHLDRLHSEIPIFLVPPARCCYFVRRERRRFALLLQRDQNWQRSQYSARGGSRESGRQGSPLHAAVSSPGPEAVPKCIGSCPAWKENRADCHQETTTAGGFCPPLWPL